jgi:carbonic anhydrase
MEQSLAKMMQGYQEFREKYVLGDQAIMQYLSFYGQQPKVMVVACCDSRVDPALILQCDPGDLFVVRNVANIVPPYEVDDAHHGTSAALEFGIRFLHVKHLILLGHSQCGGIQALIECHRKKSTETSENTESSEKNENTKNKNDFINNWVSIIDEDHNEKDSFCSENVDDYAKLAIKKSYHNCLTFPWIREKIEKRELALHLWYFDIKTGRIFNYVKESSDFQPL